MPQRVIQIVVVLLLLFSGKSFSQQQTPLSVQKTPHIFKYPARFREKTFGYAVYIQTKEPKILIANPIINFAEPISADFYSTHLGFFCRKELQVEKFSSLPLRFRLGSLEYVNRMEGKGNCGF
jgi:hypothetical protein